MGILQKLIGGGGTPAIGAIGNVIGTVFEGKGQKLSHEEIMAKLAMSPTLAMQEMSKIEAGHRSVFVAGWRPAIGWVCASGLLFSFVINPVLQWVTSNPGPEMPTAIMTTMVTTLLGLGGLRTVEKLQGKAK